MVDQNMQRGGTAGNKSEFEISTRMKIPCFYTSSTGLTLFCGLVDGSPMSGGNFFEFGPRAVHNVPGWQLSVRVRAAALLAVSRRFNNGAPRRPSRRRLSPSLSERYPRTIVDCITRASLSWWGVSHRRGRVGQPPVRLTNKRSQILEEKVRYQYLVVFTWRVRGHLVWLTKYY